MKDDGYQTKRHTGKLKHHLLLALLLLFVVSFVLWADNFNLEVVSVAEGEVKPKGETKSIQHLEGGIVKEILVEEGEEVSKGNSLMILESTLSDADVKELQARQDFLKIQTIRLKAEIRGSGGIRFPRQLAKNNSELIQQEKALHAARRKKLLNELKIADEKINQRKQEINEANAEIREIEARLKNSQNSLALINEQVAISEDLLKDDLTNRYNHLNLLKESNLLKSRIEEDMAVLSRLAAVVLRQKSSVRDTRSLKENINLMFSQEVHTQLEERQKEFRETRERLRKAKDNLKRTVLRSPVNGIVKKIRIVTKGGVVPPGGKVIDIIPAEGGLVVEARMPPYDIGYVSVGQKGTIKLKSTDAIRFGNVAVKVHGGRRWEDPLREEER